MILHVMFGVIPGQARSPRRKRSHDDDAGGTQRADAGGEGGPSRRCGPPLWAMITVCRPQPLDVLEREQIRLLAASFPDRQIEIVNRGCTGRRRDLRKGRPRREAVANTKRQRLRERVTPQQNGPIRPGWTHDTSIASRVCSVSQSMSRTLDRRPRRCRSCASVRRNRRGARRHCG